MIEYDTTLATNCPGKKQKYFDKVENSKFDRM